jgi:putative flippase GtrA
VSSTQAQLGEHKDDAKSHHPHWQKQFIRYVVVGTATNGGGYLLFFALTALGLHPVVAISIVYPIQICLAFILNKRWSFSHEGRVTSSLAKCLVAYAVCYLLNVAVLRLFVGHLGFSHLIVQAVAIPVFALLLFLIQKYWVFRQRRIEHG